MKSFISALAMRELSSAWVVLVRLAQRASRTKPTRSRRGHRWVDGDREYTLAAEVRGKRA